MLRADPYLAPESRNLDHLIAELPRDSLDHVAGFLGGIAKARRRPPARHQPHRRSAGAPPPACRSGQNIKNSDSIP